MRELEIPARRGMILDRNGEPLAVSTPMKTVWADPRLLSTHPEAMAPLAKALELDAKKLAERVQANSAKGFMYLVRRVEPSRTIKVKEMIAEAKVLARQNAKDRAQKKTDVKIEPLGVEIDSEYRRYYPGGEVFGHILGFTNIEDQGQEGLERQFEDSIRAASRQAPRLAGRQGGGGGRAGTGQRAPQRPGPDPEPGPRPPVHRLSGTDAGCAAPQGGLRDRGGPGRGHRRGPGHGQSAVLQPQRPTGRGRATTAATAP